MVAIIMITFSSCGLNGSTQNSEGQTKNSNKPVLTQSHNENSTQSNPSSPSQSKNEDRTKDALNQFDDLEKTLNSLDDVEENDLTIPSP